MRETLHDICCIPTWACTVLAQNSARTGKPHPGLCRPGLTLQVQDAVDAVKAAHADGALYDLVLVDAFDGQDQIPAAITSAGVPAGAAPYAV